MPPAKKASLKKTTARPGPKTNASTRSSLKPSLSTSSSTRATQSRYSDIPQIAEAEKGLDDALNKLVARGLLDPANRMTLDEYIDPPWERIEEDAVEPDTDSDEEMDSDEEGSDDDTPSVTREEAIRAARLLRRYIKREHDLNDPFYGELWSLLGKFALCLEKRLPFEKEHVEGVK